MFSWFRKNRSIPEQFRITTDIHSHLIPGIDDGVKTLEEAKQVIEVLASVGYRKLITTPHIISDIYRNTPEVIMNGRDQLRAYLQAENIDVSIEAAAEYYLDESLLQRLERNESLLTFGGKYLLFETNFVTEPLILKQFIFIASTKGYKPVLAHPERYLYLHDHPEKIEDLRHRGVMFQINLSSLTGFYSKAAQRLANQLIEKRYIEWLGTDCHHLSHARLLEQLPRNKYFKKAIDLPLLNYTL